MKKKIHTNAIPAIVMLSAGLIDCILSIYQHMELLAFTKRLLMVMIIFLVLGLVLKVILDKSITMMADEEPEEEQSDEESARKEEAAENANSSNRK